ncbi:MAG: DUF4446 family protein [Actinomycetota bacterium]
MRPLDPIVLSVVAIAGASVALLALLVGTFALRRRVPAVPPLEDRTLRRILDDHAKALEQLEQAARALLGTDRRQQGLIEEAVRHTALVRYDAFDDVGGRLSFSAAFLDDGGNGIVITSINGRQDTRVYAKPIIGADSSFTLSMEEREAVKSAMATGTPATPPRRGILRRGGADDGVRT